MARSFTCTRVGSLDYIRYITDTPTLSDRVNEPKLLDFSLASCEDGSFVKLVRGDRVKLQTDTYGVWFSGYITNDPDPIILGRNASGTPVYKYKYQATSDDYILNIQPLGIIPPFINKTQGQIIKALVATCDTGSLFDVSGIEDGNLVAYYEIDPEKKLWDVVKDLADKSFYRYWCNDYSLYFRPADADSAGIIVDGNDKHFTPSSLQITVNQEQIVNDVVVVGEVEPQGYINEYFVGDGLTAKFPLLAGVYGVSKSVILSEDFSGTEIDSGRWEVVGDPTETFVTLFNGYLNIVGGNNAGDYDVYIQSLNPIPLEGNLRLTHGEFDFVSASSGMIASLWTGTPDVSLTGCVFGLKCSKDGSDTVLTPVANGVADTAQNFTVDSTKRYVIRTIANFLRKNRYTESYSYIDSTGTVGTYGGVGVEDTVTFTTHLTEIDPNTGLVTSTTVLTNANVALDNSTLAAFYIPAISDDLHVAMTAITISVPVEAALQVQPGVDDGYDPDAWVTELIGPNDLDAQDGLSPEATIIQADGGTKEVIGPQVIRYNPGHATLEFFKSTTSQTSTVPEPYEIIHVTYRRAGASIARVSDSASISSEATIWGDSGRRSLLKKDLDPKPKNSAECEFAAGAILQDKVYNHYDGSYSHHSNTSFTANPQSGTVLHFQNLPSSAFPNISVEWVTEVTTQFLSTSPSELFLHTLQFGRTEKAVRELSQLGYPTGAVIPQDSVEVPKYIDITAVGTSFAPDVVNPKFVSWDATSYNFDVNQTIPSGGGFEIRYTDVSWGPSDGKNLITRLTSATTFSIPRSRRTITAFIRAYDSSGNYSRYSAGVRLVFPFIPPEVANLTGVLVDDSTIKFDYDLPSDDTINDVFQVVMEDQFGAIMGTFTPDYTSVHQTNLLAVPSTFTVVAGDTVYVKTFNILGESSDLLTGFSSGTEIDPQTPGVQVGGNNGVDDGMIHVREYGAVGDGITDDTARIQAALDAAGSVAATDNGASNVVLAVTVKGKTMPWSTSSNPSLSYGINDGLPPVVVKSTLAAGQAITISASGLVQPSDSRPYVGPDGQSGEVTGDTLGSTSTYFPTHYIDGATIRLAGLVGAFTDPFGVVVQAVQIGSGPLTLTVPSGATLLQLGINDDHFSDNLGSFTANVTIFPLSAGVGAAAKNRKIVFMPSDMTCGVGGGVGTIVADHVGPYDANYPASSYYNETTNTLLWANDTTPGANPTNVDFTVLQDGVTSTFSASVPGHFNGGADPAQMLADDDNIFIPVNNGYGSGEWHKVDWDGNYQGTWGACFTLGGTDYILGGALGYIGTTQHIAFNYGLFSNRVWLIKTSNGTGAGEFGPGVNTENASFNTSTPGQGPLGWDGDGNTWVMTGSGDLKKIDWSTNPGTVTTYSSMYSGVPEAILYVELDNTLLLVTDTHIYKFSLGTHLVINSIAKVFAGVGPVASNHIFAAGVDLVNALTLAIIEDQNEADFDLPNPLTDYAFGRPYDPASNTIYAQDSDEQVYGLTSTADLGMVLSIPSNVDFLIDGTLKLLPYISGGYILGSEDTTNVRVRGRGRIICNDSTYQSVRSGGGMYFKNCTNLRVQDLQVSGANVKSAVYLDNVDQCWVHNLYIDGTVATVAQPGIKILDSNNLSIESNMIRYCPSGIEHDGLTLSNIQGNIIAYCTAEFSPLNFDETVVVNSQIANGSADRRYVEYILVNGTRIQEPNITVTPDRFPPPPVVADPGPPLADTTWALETGHNTSAYNAYNATNFPANFTGTTWTDQDGTTMSVDSSKTDDSLNPITPAHVSNIDVHTLLPSNPTIPWYVHITPWFGKNSHIRIGVNCNTDAWVQAFVEDAVRRGFNGVSIDWYGQHSSENEVTLKLQAYLAARPSNQFKFLICFDKGIPGLNQSVLIDEITYCQNQYFDDPNYIRVDGKPVLQFFGVANTIGDTGMAAVKAATTGSNGFWQLQVSKIGQSYVDGCFDWTHNWHHGVDISDPYNLDGLDTYFTNIATHPTKPCFVAPCAGFNGYLTNSLGWSKGKYLPRGDGECWISYNAEIDPLLTSQCVGVMVPTWNDWEEGSDIEAGIENNITVTAAIASPPTLTWSASGGTGDEQTIYQYVVWATTDGVNLKYLATVATGVGTYDLSTATGLVTSTVYTIYVEAIGQPCIRNHMSNGVSYTA